MRGIFVPIGMLTDVMTALLFGVKLDAAKVAKLIKFIQKAVIFFIVH